MVKLNMSNNRIKGAEAGKALGDALAANTVLKELDLSKNSSGPEFAKEFAVGLGANRALVKFNISKNNLFAEGTKLAAQALKGNQIMTELNISGNYMGWKDGNGASDTSGIIAISNAIPTMGALTSLDISKNRIGFGGNMEGVTALAEAIKVNVSALQFDCRLTPF